MRNDLTADIKTCSCLKALIVLFGLIQTFIHPSPAPITLIRMSPHRFVIFTRVGRLFCLKYRNIIFSKEKKSLFHAVVQYCQFNFSPWYNNVQVLFYFFQDNVTPSENTADNAKGRTWSPFGSAKTCISWNSPTELALKAGQSPQITMLKHLT